MPTVSATVPPAAWAGVFYFRLQCRFPRQFRAYGGVPVWLAYDHCHQRIGAVPFGREVARPAKMTIQEHCGKTYAVPVRELEEFRAAMRERMWE